MGHHHLISILLLQLPKTFYYGAGLEIAENSPVVYLKLRSSKFIQIYIRFLIGVIYLWTISFGWLVGWSVCRSACRNLLKWHFQRSSQNTCLMSCILSFRRICETLMASLYIARSLQKHFRIRVYYKCILIHGISFCKLLIRPILYGWWPCKHYIHMFYIIQFIKEVTIKPYVLIKNPDGPFHGSC